MGIELEMLPSPTFGTFSPLRGEKALDGTERRQPFFSCRRLSGTWASLMHLSPDAVTSLAAEGLTLLPTSARLLREPSPLRFSAGEKVPKADEGVVDRVSGAIWTALVLRSEFGIRSAP